MANKFSKIVILPALIALLLLLMLTLFSCDGGLWYWKKHHKNPTPPPTVDTTYTTCKPITKSDNTFSTKVKVESWWIDGDCAYIPVGYSGCGRRNDFLLVWDGSVMESFPPQCRLTLTDTLTGPTCMMYVMDTLRFNLQTLRKASTGGDILVNINGAKPVLYSPK